MPPLPASATAPIDVCRATSTPTPSPQIARVRHVALDLTADFAAKTLSGTATLDVTAEPGATEVVLDTKNLDIRVGRATPTAQPLQFDAGRRRSDPGPAADRHTSRPSPRARRRRSSSTIRPGPTPRPCNG